MAAALVLMNLEIPVHTPPPVPKDRICAGTNYAGQESSALGVFEDRKHNLSKKNSGYFIQSRSCIINTSVEYALNSLTSAIYRLFGSTTVGHLIFDS